MKTPRSSSTICSPPSPLWGSLSRWKLIMDLPLRATNLIAHHTGIPYNPQGPAVIERAYQTLKSQTSTRLSAPKQSIKSGTIYSRCAKCLCYPGQNLTVCHWNHPPHIPPILVWRKDPLDRCWKKPAPLLTAGKGFACGFQQDQTHSVCVPAHSVCHSRQEPQQTLLNWELKLLSDPFGLLMPLRQQVEKRIVVLGGMIDPDYHGEIGLLLCDGG